MTINVKVLPDRKLDIKNRCFGGVQGDIENVDISFDISDVVSENQSWRVEFVGGAGTFESTVPITPNGNKIRVKVPSTICDIGGTAQVYLIEELITDKKVTKRVCSYPLRLYFYNKPNGKSSNSVAEYERNITDMYLFVASKASEIEEFEKTLNTLAEDVDKANATLDSHSTAISTYGTMLGNVQGDISKHSARLDSHDTAISTYGAMLGNMQGDVGALQSDFGILQYDVTQKLDNKADKFNLNPDEALEFIDGEDGTPILRIENSNEIYQDQGHLVIDKALGLKEYTSDNPDKNGGAGIGIDPDAVRNEMFRLNSDEALELLEDIDGGVPTLRIRGGNEISSYDGVLAISKAYGLKEYGMDNPDENGLYGIGVDTDVIQKKLTIDDSLSSVSENPIQNKAVFDALKTKQTKEKFELIRTIKIGDETTYSDHDVIVYDDNGKVKTINVYADNDDKPFHLDDIFIKQTIAATSDMTASYGVNCNPYSSISLNSSGYPTETKGYKLNNTGATFNPTVTSSQRIRSQLGEDGLILGYSTVNFSSSGADGTVYYRMWCNSGNKVDFENNLWGKISKTVHINSVIWQAYTANSFIPDGSSISIYGVRKDED